MFHGYKPKLSLPKHSLLMFILHTKFNRNPPSCFGNQRCGETYTISAITPLCTRCKGCTVLYDRTSFPSLLVARTMYPNDNKRHQTRSRSYIEVCCFCMWTHSEKKANSDDGLVFSGTIPMNHQRKLPSRSFIRSQDANQLISTPRRRTLILELAGVSPYVSHDCKTHSRRTKKPRGLKVVYIHDSVMSRIRKLWQFTRSSSQMRNN